MLVTAFALPDIKRSSPISVTADTPVLYVFKPVTKSSLTDGFGYPVYCVVVPYKILTHVRHLDEPGIARVVDKRCTASPAMRIAVFKFGCRE